MCDIKNVPFLRYSGEQVTDSASADDEVHLDEIASTDIKTINLVHIMDEIIPNASNEIKILSKTKRRLLKLKASKQEVISVCLN